MPWRDFVQVIPEHAREHLDPKNSSIEGGGSPHGMSRMETARACPRKYAWRYGQSRLRLPAALEPEGRFFGTLGHILLAYWEVQKMPDALRPAWFDEMEGRTRMRQVASTRLDMADAVEECFQQYIRYWSGRDNWETLGVELGLAATMAEIYPACAPEHADLKVTISIDRLVARDGHVDIMDYKFKNVRGSTLPRWNATTSSEHFLQAATYLHVARARGLPIRGHIIRRIKRNGDFASDDNYVMMGDNYRHIPRLIYEYVVGAAQLDKQLAAGGEAWPNFASCTQRYGQCDYFGVCHLDMPISTLKG